MLVSNPFASPCLRGECDLAIDDLETYRRLAPDAADADEILRQVDTLKKGVARLH